jgi:hypothetical protein
MIVEGAGMLHTLTVKGAEILYNTMEGAEALWGLEFLMMIAEGGRMSYDTVQRT